MQEGVEFHEPKITPEERYGLRRPVSKMAELVIKYSRGYIKNEREANLALLGFVALVIIISLILLLRGTSSTSIDTEEFKAKNRAQQSIP